MNLKDESFDSSGKLLNSITLDPEGTELESLDRIGGLLIKGTRGTDGKLSYRFKDESDNRRGTMVNLPAGGMRLYYDDYETVEFSRDGTEVKRYNRLGDRSFNQWISHEFKMSVLRAAVGLLEGASGLIGTNDVINMAGQAMGYNPHLATRQEVLDSFEQASNSLLQAGAEHAAIVASELAVYRAGGQSLSDVFENSMPSLLNVLNEESKFFLGTDWSGIGDNPGAILGSVTIGFASLYIPVKGPRIIKGALESEANVFAEYGVHGSRSGKAISYFEGEALGSLSTRSPVLYGVNRKSIDAVGHTDSMAKATPSPYEGTAPTVESIRLGTVRMEEHPSFAAVQAHLEKIGYPLRVESYWGRPPRVARSAIVDAQGNVIGYEQYIRGISGMRFLDLEHEFGHVDQMLYRFRNNPPIHDRIKRVPGKPDSSVPHKPDDYTGRQDKIAEFHIRLKEYLWLAQRGASREVLDQQADLVTDG
ncbi:hypothetical protein [Nocardia sp. CC227C]|uniref:hypothetical protein n=1 Tax=Nocardia sp. CC227C TaxID=3044562 RepID=UPI00278C7AD8|nr:hypothetical protein [Nocardia sp. CC227C]